MHVYFDTWKKTLLVTDLSWGIIKAQNSEYEKILTYTTTINTGWFCYFSFVFKLQRKPEKLNLSQFC